jgi:hypothetical protein
MSDEASNSVPRRSHILAALRELITALDRRVPYADRSGEIQIARNARALRNEAAIRIAGLERAESEDHVYDETLVDAIMTDDGGPPCASFGDVSPDPML